MTCINCGKEVPSTAKFCPHCGAKNITPPQPLKCPSCGLEQPAGAKFCSVCGAAMSSGVSLGYAGNVDNPSASESLVAAMPSIAPVTPTAPISLGKSVSEGAVSTPSDTPAPVNSAASYGAGVPVPTNSAASYGAGVPVPTNSAASYGAGVPVPTNSAASYGTGVPAPANDPASFGTAVPTPANGGSGGFAPARSGVSFAQTRSIPDYGMSDAAVVVKPIKKSKAPLIIILSSVAAILLILGILFFFNKGAVLNLIMGDSGYAAMLEKSSIKDITALADNPALDAGLQSAGKTVVNAMTAYNSGAMSDTVSSSVSPKNLLSPMQSEMDGVSVDIKANLTLTDTARSLLSDAGEVDDLLDSINNTSFGIKAVTDDDNALLYAELVNKGLTLNAQALFLGNDMYLSFPFGSDKAVKFTFDTADMPAADIDEFEFEYDAEDFSKLLDKLGDIYIKYYENASVSSDSEGEITAAGVSAKGKYILVTLDNTMLKDMFTEMLECVAEDEPLYEAVSECAKESDYEITREQYKSAINSIISEIDFDSEDALAVGTVLDSKGNVIAKEYAAIDGDNSLYLSFITGKEKSAIEIGENGTAFFAASISKTPENSGTINAKFSDGNSYPFALKLDYDGVGTEQFGDIPVGVGTYILSFTPPADFTDGAEGDMLQFLNAFSAAKFTLSSSVSGKDYIEKFSVDIPQYGSASMDITMTQVDESIPDKAPADVIDVTPAYTDPNVTEEQEQELAKELAELVDELKAKVDGTDSEFTGAVAELLGELSDSLRSAAEPKAADSDIEALDDRLGVDVNKVDSLIQQYGEDEKANEIRRGLNELLSEVWMSWQEGMSLDLYDYYISRAEDLETQLENLTAELKKKAEQAAAASSTAKKDYSKMSFEEIYDAAVDLENRFISDLSSMGNEYPSERAEELTNDCVDAYNELLDDITDLNDAYMDGVADVALLRETRKSAKALDDALTELEKEIYGNMSI